MYALQIVLMVMLPVLPANRDADVIPGDAVFSADNSPAIRGRQLTTNNEQYPDPCQTMPDLCEAYDNGGSGSGSGSIGGNYAYCYADKYAGQKCVDKVTYYTPAGACVNGCAACASVMYSAKCQCNVNTLVTSGTCNYR